MASVGLQTLNPSAAHTPRREAPPPVPRGSSSISGVTGTAMYQLSVSSPRTESSWDLQRRVTRPAPGGRGPGLSKQRSTFFLRVCFHQGTEEAPTSPSALPRGPPGHLSCPPHTHTQPLLWSPHTGAWAQTLKLWGSQGRGSARQHLCLHFSWD